MLSRSQTQKGMNLVSGLMVKATFLECSTEKANSPAQGGPHSPFY